MAEQVAASPPLTALIAAASAPAQDDEADTGLTAAMSAFTAEHASSAEPPRKVHRSRVVRLAGGRAVALAIVLVVFLGGVAAAVGTGRLGNPFVRSGTRDANTTARPHLSTVLASPSHDASHTVTSDTASPLSPSASPTAAVGTSGAPTSNALADLCQAWRTRPNTAQRNADPAFAPLVAEAGNAGGVDAYCVGVLTGHTGSPSTGSPSSSSISTGTSTPSTSSATSPSTSAPNVSPGQAKRSSTAADHGSQGNGRAVGNGHAKHGG